MAGPKIVSPVLPLLLLFLPLYASAAAVKDDYAENDIRCLKTLKSTVEDPRGSLSSWTFNNESEGFICKFVGVQCWHPGENRVLAIDLTGIGLRGSFPRGLQYCGSLTDLNLSDNNFTGRIPRELSVWLPYLVALDLSQNHFTGSIPSELANCTYLNIIRLNDNMLTGEIPWQLSRLRRLREFVVADNHLSGRIPAFFSKFNASSFESNPGLCGPPLKNCTETSWHSAEGQSH